MSDKIHSSSFDSHELQLKMSVPQQQQLQQSHHEYGGNLSQDIQLQVIIKENESSLRRTKASNSKASPAFAPSMIKKPVTRAQDLPDDNTTINGNCNGQYGKINLNHCRDFRIEKQQQQQQQQQQHDENPYGNVPEVLHHPPTSFLASEKSEKKIKCWDSFYLSENINSLISDIQLERTWKYLKWPFLLFLLCVFLGLITYACVNSRNGRPKKSNCLNCYTNPGSIEQMVLDEGATESLNKSDTNSSVSNEKIKDSFSKTEISFQSDEEEKDEIKDKDEIEEKKEEASEAVLTGSTTLLRPIVVPHLTHSGYREKNYLEKGSKNDYTILERKPSQKNKEAIPNTRIQSPYGQGVAVDAVPNTKEEKPPFGHQGSSETGSKNKTEGIKVVGFTSGHQNNFGVPIEEDERILKLLNDELSKLEKQTEHSNVVDRTESSLIVSPTVPQILHEVQEYVTPSSRPFEEIQCQSTALPMCRGVLQYDLTSSNAKSLYLSPAELEVFEMLISSNCSARAIEFVCSNLEPECRPTQIGILQPCKRICKSILEACSSLIASSDILTYTFDCDKYPDSYDRNICEDPTRRSECYDNEFKCEDFSCIPSQWQCDNIKDCSEGEDELGCLVCNPEEFRCRSNEKCLSDGYRCDNNEDCDDGSDEHDCFSENDDEDPELYPRIFSFASFLLPNYTSENTFTTIADEDRLAAGSELNESLATASGSNVLHGITVLEDIKSGSMNMSRNLANFQDSKEIMMTSDSENKMNISHNSSSNATELNKTESKSELTMPPSCPGNELRCVSGKCITVDQLCDKVMDCPDGEDELMCTYEERPNPKPKKP